MASRMLRSISSTDLPVVMHVVTRVARYRGLLVSRPARRVYTTKGNSRRPADIVLGASV